MINFILKSSIDNLKISEGWVMQLFLKEQDKCKLEKGPGVRFLLQGEAIKLWFMNLSVKTLMCFLWLNYEIYATIFPLYFWLVSFLICVNYSIGILISSLRFLCLKCLLTVGGTQYCHYYVWIMVYMLCILVFQMLMI